MSYLGLVDVPVSAVEVSTRLTEAGVTTRGWSAAEPLRAMLDRLEATASHTVPSGRYTALLLALVGAASVLVDGSTHLGALTLVEEVAPAGVLVRTIETRLTLASATVDDAAVAQRQST